MLNGIELWQTILDDLLNPPGAMIAGGAVRDFWLEKKPKDIDVFLVYKDDEYYGARYDNLRAKGWVYDSDETGKVSNQPENYRTEAGDIDSIECWKAYDQLIQLIYLKDDRSPIEYLYGFDLGTTRCLYDGNLFFTQEFLTDVTNKTVTQLTTTSMQRTKERAEAFIARNPDFTFKPMEDQITTIRGQHANTLIADDVVNPPAVGVQAVREMMINMDVWGRVRNPAVEGGPIWNNQMFFDHNIAAPRNFNGVDIVEVDQIPPAVR